MLLNLESSNGIIVEEMQELDEMIVQTITKHKENGALINRLVMDGVTALTTSEARSKALADQGFFHRFWGGITGGNNEIRSRVENDLSKAQYASQQLIQRLAEQNALTFDTITMVNNKLNAFVIETDEEINRIYETLVQFFKQSRAELIQLESRVATIERNVRLLHWESTIEYQMYNGIEYHELQDIEKISCIANDFFQISEGKWSTSDLLLLKPILKELGMSDKTKISYEYFIKSIIQHPMLLEKLFDGISQSNISEFGTWEMPVLKGIEKSKELKLADKYIIDTITQQLEFAQVSFDEIEIQTRIVQNYMQYTAAINVKQEVSLFEFIVELLSSLKILSAYDEITTNDAISIIQNEIVEDDEKDCTELEVAETHLKLRDYIHIGTEEFSGLKHIWQVIKVENERCLLWAVTRWDTLCDGKSWDQSVTRKMLHKYISDDDSLLLLSEKEKTLILPTEVESIVSDKLFEGPLKEYLDQNEEKNTIKTTDRIFTLSLHELKTLVYDQNFPYRKAVDYILRDASGQSTLGVSTKQSSLSLEYFYGIMNINPKTCPHNFNLGYTYPAVYISNEKLPYGSGYEDDPYRMEE